MITVHHLENSQSFRILWLLEELEAEYSIEPYLRDKATSLAPTTFKRLHPAGTSPAISDGELFLPETNAIVDYILDKYPASPLRPTPDSPERVKYLYWFHTAQGSFMPMLLMGYVLNKMAESAPLVARTVLKIAAGKASSMLITPRLKGLFDTMETDLKLHDWLAGDYLTAADIVMSYCLTAAEGRLPLLSSYPKVKGLLERIKERPAYQRALDRERAAFFVMPPR